MLTSTKIGAIALATLSLLAFTPAQAGEGRYQAHWDGKSYLILDTDRGHMWTFRGNSMLYNGRIDGDDFEPPEKPKVWQQSHGKWTLNK